MIQFNLLPDVKIKYIKARRQKRLFMLVAFFVSAGSLAVLAGALFVVYVVQGAQIKSLDDKIEKSSTSITQKQGQVDDINKVLTVQNQLISLDDLHAKKPATSRLFDYLAKLLPSQIAMTKISVDNTEGSDLISIQGTTNTLETVNKFVDTLKFTEFKMKDSDEKKTIFSDVVLSNFSRDKSGASFTVTLKYDPIIFDQSQEAQGLVVPKGLITTRSELGRPIIQTATEQQNNAPDPEVKK